MTTTQEQLTEVELYTAARTSIVCLIKTLPEDRLDETVPACPRWSARDLIAHQAGVSVDFATGNFPAEGMSAGQWTQNQVDSRKGRSVAELLQEWDGVYPQLQEMITEGKVGARALVNDPTVHEQDLRCQFNIQGGTDGPNFEYCVETSFTSFGERITKAELPALTVNLESGPWKLGEGDSGMELDITRYGLVRAIFGRRSPAQLASLKWSGDGAPYVAVMPIFGPAEHDVNEPF